MSLYFFIILYLPKHFIYTFSLNHHNDPGNDPQIYLLGLKLINKILFYVILTIFILLFHFIKI